MVDHYTQFSEEMVATLAGRLLGSSAISAVKALPAPFSETVKEPVPAWVKAKVKDVATLVGRITGKTNAKSKTAILEVLNSLA